MFFLSSELNDTQLCPDHSECVPDGPGKSHVIIQSVFPMGQVRVM